MYTIRILGAKAVKTHDCKNIGAEIKRIDPLGPTILTDIVAPRLPKNAPKGAKPPLKLAMKYALNICTLFIETMLVSSQPEIFS